MLQIEQIICKIQCSKGDLQVLVNSGSRPLMASILILSICQAMVSNALNSLEIFAPCLITLIANLSKF